MIPKAIRTKAGCLATLTPPGKYSLQFFQKKKFNNQIALLRYYDSFKDYKGNIKVYPQTNNDYSFKSYYKNLELLLKRENFSSPDNTIMELSEDIPCGDCSEEIIKLYCDQRYITITILNNGTFLEQTINQNLIDSIFDKGIVPLVTQCVLEKTKKKDIANVTIKDFLSLMKKYNYSDLNYDERQLMRFDSVYLNTKAFFKDGAAFLTMKHSHALRKLRKIIRLLCLLFMTVITVLLVVHKANFKFLL